MTNDVLAQAGAWLDTGEPVALATIVRIFGSSSQPLGARMAMTTGNRFAGAVSGGCVETDVYETGMVVLERGGPLMLHYQHVEDPLIEIGLNCDGQIDVLVEPIDREGWALLAEPPLGSVTVTLCTPGQPRDPDVVHARVMPDGAASLPLPPPVIDAARAALDGDQPVTLSLADGRVALLEPVVPPLTLLIFGGDQAAVPLVRLARAIGWRAIVTDARPAFATRAKHPDADEVIAAWPQQVVERVGIDRWTFVVSLNHEPRFEDALCFALAGTPVRYVGAIGKRVRQQERVERLTAAGFDLSQLPPIHTPIGLDIGGKTPEEIALSILAEIIAVKNGRPGGKLSASG